MLASFIKVIVGYLFYFLILWTIQEASENDFPLMKKKSSIMIIITAQTFEAQILENWPFISPIAKMILKLIHTFLLWLLYLEERIIMKVGKRMNYSQKTMLLFLLEIYFDQYAFRTVASELIAFVYFYHNGTK